MKKVELLAPAGDEESAIGAIQNGADALYLGGTLYSARAYANNFDNEKLSEIVRYAHLRDVKVYVTVNTLYHDDEFDALIKYIDYLYDIKVDALIIQDIGLFSVVRERYPDFDIHISTQASVMNLYGCLYYQEKGAKRVVLARENTLEEIQYMAQNSAIELEVFVHGALCICYSGQCLMSQRIGQRSGNRGECAQPCRLKYQLMENDVLLDSDNPYLLSPKDLMTIDHVGELIEAGVHSFKIEGRMKSPQYVASVVRSYRKAIDAYYNHQKADLKDDKKMMKQMFNRDYTTGYLFHDKNLVKGDYSGNKGVIIGKVLAYNKKRKRVKIKLNESLTDGDSIVFEDIDKGRPINKIFKNNQLISKAMPGDKIEIEFDYPVASGNVRKTLDSMAVKEIKKTYEKDEKKLPITLEFKAHLNHCPVLKARYKNKEVIVYGDNQCEGAFNQPLSKERVEQQLLKLGHTPFRLDQCNIDIDEVFIPISTINKLRRDAIEQLSKSLVNPDIHHSFPKDVSIQPDLHRNKGIDIYVSNLKQLSIALKYPFRNYLYPYKEDTLKALDMCHEAGKKMVLYNSRIMKTKEIDQIKKSSVYQAIDTIMVNDIGSFYAFKDKNIIIGNGLNVYNSYALNYFKGYQVLVSLELDKEALKKLQGDYQFMIYGNSENMISEYCPISQYYFNKQKKYCNKCINHEYYLIDRKKARYPLMMDEQCRMHLYHSKPFKMDNIKEIKSTSYYVSLLVETPKQTVSILDDIFQNILNS